MYTVLLCCFLTIEVVIRWSCLGYASYCVEDSMNAKRHAVPDKEDDQYCNVNSAYEKYCLKSHLWLFA